ncbi:transmembrane protein 200A [Eucyclogobius newberryi]|uniref:transmembrane protein 200A n=1 Tax=Eucyclogobius newberryi TaxID=166745 RepID=UPI003B5A99C7
MKSKKSQDESSSPSQRRRSCFSLRGRRKKSGAIRGKLRMRSLPGAFILLGLVVVVVGTALAVAGYWPYRLSKTAVLAEGEESPSGWNLGAKGLLSTARASLVHSDRMKLLGPVIMGVGLFILICANTVLYENRDRETQMLLAQMRSVICSVSAAVPSADLQEIAVTNSMTKHYQWVSSLPAAHLNIMCLQQLACSEPILRTHSGERDYHQAVLQTEALHHQESESTPSLKSSKSNSCNSSPTHFKTPPISDDLSPKRTVPSIKVDNCLVSAGSMSTLGVEENVDVPLVLPRRCHSLSYRTNPYKHGVHLKALLKTTNPDTKQLAGQRNVRSPHVCVSIPGQIVDSMSEDLTHRSWPRLDLGIGRRYLKLENKEDSVDKLLDQLENQCSQWDKSFGSGPFQ